MQWLTVVKSLCSVRRMCGIIVNSQDKISGVIVGEPMIAIPIITAPDRSKELEEQQKKERIERERRQLRNLLQDIRNFVPSPYMVGMSSQAS